MIANAQMTPQPIRTFHREKLLVEVYGTEPEVGEAAAALVEQRLQATIIERRRATLILATGTSQLSFLEVLEGAAHLVYCGLIAPQSQQIRSQVEG